MNKNVLKPCVTALILAAGFHGLGAAQTLNPKLVPLPAEAQRIDYLIFALGSVDDFPFYARATKSEAGTPADVCTSNKIYIEADETRLNSNYHANAIFRKTVRALYEHCGGKMPALKRNQTPSPLLREYLTAQHVSIKDMKIILTKGEGYEDIHSNRIYFDSINPTYVTPKSSSKEATEPKEVKASTKQPVNLSEVVSPPLRTPMFTYTSNLAQLQALYKTHNIDSFVSIGNIEANPFAYEGKTILTKGRFIKAMSATEVLVKHPRYRALPMDGADLILSPTTAGQWKTTSYLLVIQLKGRFQGNSEKPPVATVLHSIACKEFDCDDMLTIPDATGTGKMSFGYGMQL